MTEIHDLVLTDLSDNKMLVNAFDIALVRATRGDHSELVLKDVHVAVSNGMQFNSDIRGYTVQVKESIGQIAAMRVRASGHPAIRPDGRSGSANFDESQPPRGEGAGTGGFGSTLG